MKMNKVILVLLYLVSFNYSVDAQTDTSAIQKKLKNYTKPQLFAEYKPATKKEFKWMIHKNKPKKHRQMYLYGTKHPVKDSIRFHLVRAERDDTVAVYIDNKLFHRSFFPLITEADPNCPLANCQYPTICWKNNEKKKRVRLTVVFEKDKIYLDTIINTMYDIIHIESHGFSNWQLIFWMKYTEYYFQYKIIDEYKKRKIKGWEKNKK